MFETLSGANGLVSADQLDAADVVRTIRKTGLLKGTVSVEAVNNEGELVTELLVGDATRNYSIVTIDTQGNELSSYAIPRYDEEQNPARIAALLDSELMAVLMHIAGEEQRELRDSSAA